MNECVFGEDRCAKKVFADIEFLHSATKLLIKFFTEWKQISRRILSQTFGGLMQADHTGCTYYMMEERCFSGGWCKVGVGEARESEQSTGT